MACCKEVEQAFAQMLEEFEAADSYLKMELLRGILTIILARLSRAAPLVFKDGTSKHHIVLFRQFEQLIEMHFREKRLPKDYGYFTRFFKKHLGITPEGFRAVSLQAEG